MTNIEQAINLDLGKIDKWYEENEMKWNEKSFIEHLLFHTLVTVQSLGIFVVLTQQKN